MTRPHRRLALVLAAAAFAASSFAATDPTPPAPAAVRASSGGSADSLNAKYTELRDKLARNNFGRPIYLDSGEAGRTQRGDVYAVIDHAFGTVERGLSEASSWCDVLILPYNTKHCHADGTGPSTGLTLRIGRKADQAAEDAHPIAFKYNLQASSPDYFRAVLDAADGPLGTSNYRIVLEATPIGASHTFIHLGYSYGFSAVSRFAMQAYLATAGANKVGFTVVGKDGNGEPKYVGGMLGATERNTMRYFLAIDAYLASLAVPETQRLEKRLNDWYGAAHKYPRQLSEMDRSEYLAMKRKEASRLREAL